ncbi:unannotated protein [freshwater metagenome]|uniref:Unannotated protein n=1 Tax=freshwater metagenome TaxID=449393 RepID=A0A6J7ENS9_9ZZZZ
MTLATPTNLPESPIKDPQRFLLVASEIISATTSAITPNIGSLRKLNDWVRLAITNANALETNRSVKNCPDAFLSKACLKIKSGI